MFRYTIGTTDWKILKLPQEDLKAEYAPFYRLSNGKLAFGYSYIDIHEHNSIVNPEIAAIYMWDDQTNHFEVLHRYDEGFFNGTFTFSPDMSESILENPVGSGYHNQLYRFDRNKQMTRLLADYERVSDPSWSPDGRMIAFLGTESYTPKTLIGFLDWNLLRDRFFYPWDLYLMGANGKNVRIILAGIEGESKIGGWLSIGRLLSFTGKYKKTDGIWMLNIETHQLTRVWASAADYHWSPDGTQMVVIQRVKEGDIERTYPVIVDLPNL